MNLKLLLFRIYLYLVIIITSTILIKSLVKIREHHLIIVIKAKYLEKIFQKYVKSLKVIRKLLIIFI